jgi:hypothetical protein
MEFILAHLAEIIFGLVSAGALAYCKHLYNQKLKLEEAAKADQNRQYRQMIIDEIEPIIEEIHRVQKSSEDKINALKEYHIEDMGATEHEIELLKKKNDKNMEMIISSYKFRLIQLCKTHLRDKSITQDEFDQVSEMYKLYHGLGGNGQAQEYYEKVLELPIRD